LHARPALIGVLYSFAAGLPSGLLGALLTFAGKPLYPSQSSGAVHWGLTRLEDQQLAGLIMWMPGGLVYLCAAPVWFVWLRSEEQKARGYGCRGDYPVRPVPGGEAKLGKQAITAMDAAGAM
jgi:cytochrome c oxidase assembly factor CtaG